mmetsp:Transcript_20234/g.63649  ORF Transcript_20234/g.63649 Transcript_20234/m.63649 type:complete len:128 (+) Transcript_20234:72-455(+)
MSARLRYAYNAALRAGGLESRRKLNQVDGAGRLVAKPQRAPQLPVSAQKSKYHGVTFLRDRRKFRAQYSNAAGKHKSAGYFLSQEEAAHAYNSVIIRLGLQSIRKLNPVDSEGRLVEKTTFLHAPRE